LRSGRAIYRQRCDGPQDSSPESGPRSGSQLAGFDLIDITPDPRFSRLDRAHEWMLGVVEVLGRMPVLRRVAAGRMSTDHAHTQVDPRIASLHAVFTHVFVGLPYFDLIEVSAFVRHRFLRLFTSE
jgi:hypothetical protein